MGMVHGCYLHSVVLVVVEAIVVNVILVVSSSSSSSLLFFVVAVIVVVCVRARACAYGRALVYACACMRVCVCTFSRASKTVAWHYTTSMTPSIAYYMMHVNIKTNAIYYLSAISGLPSKYRSKLKRMKQYRPT